MTDEELGSLWLRYAEENTDQNLKELESPVGFAKWLVRSKHVQALHLKVRNLWGAVIFLTIVCFILTLLIIYGYFLIDMK